MVEEVLCPYCNTKQDIRIDFFIEDCGVFADPVTCPGCKNQIAFSAKIDFIAIQDEY